MKILALNTCFNQTYVAILNDKKSKFTTMDSKLKQSENVLGTIDQCLNESNLCLQNLDAIACVIGPGSFTGIRIGASICKGFCAPLKNIKKIQVNSLDLLAHAYLNKCQPKQKFWVVLNALSGNLYARKYNIDATPIIDSILCFGQDLEKITGIVVGLEEENLDICNTFLSFTSEDLLSYSKDLYQKGEFSADFLPLYIRKSQAEAQLDEKNGNS